MHLDRSAARRRAEGGRTTGCLDDVVAFDLIEGALAGARLLDAEAHVDACDACTLLVAALTGGAAPLEAGERVGRFEIVERVGQGAMGVVYRARDPVLGRDVALKVLRAGARPDLEARMLSEAQAMARLAHPNVASVFDAGRDASGVYLAMELVRGVTLRAWLDRPSGTERRPWPEIRSVFEQAGRGLAAAHVAGLVHRDVKPENLLVGDDGRVRVSDFGLASAADAARDGVVEGTPAYMAPEQRDAGEATPKSDQYAFAVCLFEAISGQRPSGPVDAADPALEAAPASARAAVARALSADPALRFPTLEALLAALEEPEVLAPARLREVRAAPRAPWRVAAALAAALVVAALVFAALGARRARTTHPTATSARGACAAGAERVVAAFGPDRQAKVRAAFAATKSPLAEQAASRTIAALDAYAKGWSDAYASTCEASAIHHEQSEQALDARMRCLDRRIGALGALVTTLESADASVVAGATVAALDLPEVASCRRVESLVAADPRPSDPAVAARVDAIDGALDRFDVALPSQLAPALEAVESLVADARAAGYRPTLARAALVGARLARRLGRFDDAAKRAAEAELAAEASRADGLVADARLESLAIAGARGAPMEVQRGADRARASIARVGDPDVLGAGLALRLGLAATALGEFDTAEREIARAKRLTSSARGAESLDAARVLTAQADLSRLRGDLEGALALHESALAIDVKLLGGDHPSVARHHHNIGGVLRLLGRREAALASYLVALELERRGGDGSIAEGVTENSISIVLLEQGRPPEARAHVSKALAILDRAGHPDRALALLNLAGVDAAEGRHADAIADIGRAIEILEDELGRDHVRVGSALLERARSRRATRDDAGAVADLDRAAAIGALHPDAADGRDLVARVAAARAPAPPAPAPTGPASSSGRDAPRPAPTSRGGSGYGASPSWDGPASQ